ncbi:uncharacterized protein EDB91DRAFT_1087396 [Suillus paluster]|uniref:uncharacterized protein n=1 Tax=Suillus paluster TaxID=48578 RepID=UPI001B865548|nr:uncharacterized protein EDB91DRAFT_1090637 [Suillus paluster]XP_041170562.1 uncharacterized protein EDB91DRAFT_1087396 [Suillus paluster]KAG1717781.1 hypothetical protein EDB91DRAFT_1090637 [Suillus paluster]KAG1724635.1 hypothetical protein EDB91DRAFT_1087396 [Suillus paluster]
MQLSLVFTTLVSFAALAAAYPALGVAGAARASLDEREVACSPYGGGRRYEREVDCGPYGGGREALSSGVVKVLEAMLVLIVPQQSPLGASQLPATSPDITGTTHSKMPTRKATVNKTGWCSFKWAGWIRLRCFECTSRVTTDEIKVDRYRFKRDRFSKLWRAAVFTSCIALVFYAIIVLFGASSAR